MKKMIVAALGLLLTVLVAGCTSANAAGPVAGAGAPVGGWVLEAWNDPSAVPNDGITLQLADGLVSGKAACNNYSGPVMMDNGNFSVGNLAVTRMACLDAGLAAAEDTYLRLLGEVTGWFSDGTSLVLTTNGAETLRFKTV